MSKNIYTGNCLTTDACPSPPRDENKDLPAFNENRDAPNEEKETFYTQDDSTEDIPMFAKSKSKKSSASTNIINISNSSKVHIGSNVTINYGNKAKDAAPKQETVKITTVINDLFNSNEPVSVNDINFISSYMGEGWRYVARNLGYEPGQLDQFYESNFHKGIKEVIYQFLLDWIDNKADEATMGVLCRALWDSRQQYVVKYISENYKSDS